MDTSLPFALRGGGKVPTWRILNFLPRIEHCPCCLRFCTCEKYCDCFHYEIIRKHANASLSRHGYAIEVRPDLLIKYLASEQGNFFAAYVSLNEKALA